MSNVEVEGEKTSLERQDGSTGESDQQPRQTETNSDGENYEDANGVVENASNSVVGDNTDVVPNIPKHPLQYEWVLWYCKPQRGMNWEDCMKEVITFKTVEDFWAMYNHVQAVTGLPNGSDYYMFKKGIQPMWEDPQNCEGGRWLITVERNRRDALLDHYWLELLLAIVGEQFDNYGTNISGAVVNIRQKGDKVSLWTSNASNVDVNVRIGQILKQKLTIPDLITYEIHQDTKHKSSSVVKPHLRI